MCGDGVASWPEQCDDGNEASGDGCSECILDEGWNCYGADCYEVVCGNGVSESFGTGEGTWDWERCDDGNAVGGDGCTSDCRIETGYVCYADGEPCREVVCGDGFMDSYFVPGDPGDTAGTGGMGSGTGGAGGAGGGYWGTYVTETCDDSNTESGDGCDSSCNVEPGYICPVECDYYYYTCGPAPCYQPVCGDGKVDFIATGGSGGSGGTGSGSGGIVGSGGSGPAAGGFGGFGGGYAGGYYESCDDFNDESGDGCSSECAFEPGYSCPVPGEPCKLAVCGDGVYDWPVEECDDGNTEPGDGCTPDCTYDYTGGVGGAGGIGTGGTGGVGGIGGTWTAGFGGSAGTVGMAGGPVGGGGFGG